MQASLILRKSTRKRRRFVVEAFREAFAQLETRELISDEWPELALLRHLLQGGMGAEAVRDLLSNIDLRAGPRSLRYYRQRGCSEAEARRPLSLEIVGASFSRVATIQLT